MKISINILSGLMYSNKAFESKLTDRRRVLVMVVLLFVSLHRTGSFGGLDVVKLIL